MANCCLRIDLGQNAVGMVDCVSGRRALDSWNGGTGELGFNAPNQPGIIRGTYRGLDVHITKELAVFPRSVSSDITSFVRYSMLLPRTVPEGFAVSSFGRYVLYFRFLHPWWRRTGAVDGAFALRIRDRNVADSYLTSHRLAVLGLFMARHGGWRKKWRIRRGRIIVTDPTMNPQRSVLDGMADVAYALAQLPNADSHLPAPWMLDDKASGEAR